MPRKSAYIDANRSSNHFNFEISWLVQGPHIPPRLMIAIPHHALWCFNDYFHVALNSAANFWCPTFWRQHHLHSRNFYWNRCTGSNCSELEQLWMAVLPVARSAPNSCRGYNWWSRNPPSWYIWNQKATQSYDSSTKLIEFLMHCGHQPDRDKTMSCQIIDLLLYVWNQIDLSCDWQIWLLVLAASAHCQIELVLTFDCFLEVYFSELFG